MITPNDEDKGYAIPAGSLIFTGSYKGNPAYNVVLLYDQNGSIVGGVDEEGSVVASQIILRPTRRTASWAKSAKATGSTGSSRISWKT